ncbi:type VI secretion system protein TssA [Pseudomonas syringae]|uniref:Type VI secretion system protein TssA n=1 Tax=Pseudomonas syringae TaxID=317 RepID=A0A9Q3WZ73_PSESX|nr:type VI secretion system protein TssA [Pseudomonas syringae]MCF5062161.1 type VI secretion system protein TssA [Pseudomonas syringae]MCF5073347.1 type VI secretion system protein TssA [Pseudomonas syringae]MCF5118561.1 type VI secretion system protein TssA [Pseudomonas syringae]MCF5378662.1 type VI secretion system protein TssA [Pseudomonas syringae]
MSYSDKLYDHYLELARLPCSASSFVGSDIRFSADYERLETELGKAQSMHGTGQPDWHTVLEVSECILRQQSKDLRVAVWLTWALHQRESFPGLLAGLGLLRYLCEQHWPAAYPEKPRTRGAAFSWLVSRLEPLFTQSLSLHSQQPLFQSVLEHLERLDELWGEQLPNDAPLLLPVRRQLAQRLERAGQADIPASGVSGVIAQVKQVTAQLLRPEAVVDNEKDAHRLLRSLQEQARPLCAWWLRQNAADLRALRLNRTLAWLTLVSYPEADNQRITPLRGPAPDKLTRYLERFAQGHYADLLVELEASLAGALFWFDGLHKVWQCLEALQADLAMTELEVSFALLLQRLPDLPDFCFHDGTPFASADTRDWIALQVARHLQRPESLAMVADVDAAPWEIALQEAAPRLRKDGLKAAMPAFTHGMHTARSDRARFFWRLAQARLCVQAGKPELAKIQLEHLDHELQRSGLERWEPELALQVAQLLHRCCDLLPQNHAVRERKEETHRRLCLFDLEAVLE